MKPKLLPAPARLGLLLSWLSGDFNEYVWNEGDRPEDAAIWTDYPAIRRAIETFVRAFDGSAGAGHIEAEPDDTAAALSDDAIDMLEQQLKMLLEQGFGEPSVQDNCSSMMLATLRVAVHPIAPRVLQFRDTENGRHVVVGGTKARARYQAAGAYGLRVQGSIGDLVPFLLVHLLTQPGMVAVKRCARRDQPPWADCERLFIVAPKVRGRPQRFCSRNCGLRYAEQQPPQPRRRKS